MLSNTLQTQSSDSVHIVWKVDEDDNLRAYASTDLESPVVWAPQPGSQTAFLACPITECLYEGTRGPGKTDALLMDYAQHVGTGLGADWRGILFRRTSPELKDIIAKSLKWFPQIFPTAKYNRSERTWTFADGEQLIFAFMEREEHYWKYHGHAYPWIGWEELTNWPDDKLFKKMFSTSRTTNKNVPRKIRATCNPLGVGHNWVKKRYGLPSPGYSMFTDIVKTKGEPDRVAIHGTVHENRMLLHADPDYLDSLRASCDTEAELQAWLYGSWDITSGGMFDDIWLKDIHVLPEIPYHLIPRQWRLDRSYDHGQSKPFSVGWWAKSNGEPLQLPCGKWVGQVRGDLIRIAEWYGCSPTKANTGILMPAGEIAVGIREFQRDMGLDGRIHPGVADSSIFDEWEASKSVAGEMRKKRVRWLHADKGPGSRVQGWQQMRAMMKNAVPKDGYREAPGLFVTYNCKDFLRTIPTLPRCKKNPDDVDSDAEDHIADEARYRCRAKKPGTFSVTKG